MIRFFYDTLKRQHLNRQMMMNCLKIKKRKSMQMAVDVEGK